MLRPLPRMQTQGSSAAPISQKVLEFFLDLPLYELYGMSESTSPHNLFLYGKWLRPVNGNEDIKNILLCYYTSCSTSYCLVFNL